MRDNETTCAHDDAGPYLTHIKKKKKKSVHVHTTFLILDKLVNEKRS